MRTAPCYIPKLSASRVSSPVEGVRAEQPASGLVIYIASRAAEFVEVIDAVIEALLLCSSIRIVGAAGVLRRPHRVAVIPACLVNRGDLSLTITPATPATTITFSIVNSTGLCRQYSFRLCQLLLRLLLRRRGWFLRRGGVLVGVFVSTGRVPCAATLPVHKLPRRSSRRPRSTCDRGAQRGDRLSDGSACSTAISLSPSQEVWPPSAQGICLQKAPGQSR
jgi:hypothetical protein